MNESFIVYKDSDILNRLSEFPTGLLFRLKRVFYVHFERQIVVKRRYNVFCHRYNPTCDR